MNVLSRTMLLLLACSLGATSIAAAQPVAPPASAPSAPAAVSAPLPSALFAPALGQVRTALAMVRPEKWKAPGAVNQETAANVDSIEHDLDGTLPGLLATADANPASVSEVLPAYRNIEALYEVLLRVTEISKLTAPAQQSVALQQALASLEDSRRTLGNQLQTAATNQSHAIVALEGQVRAAKTAAAAPTPAPVCPTPATKPRHRTKAKPKSSSSPSSTSSGSTSGTPSH